jgi:hypothetical protein
MKKLAKYRDEYFTDMGYKNSEAKQYTIDMYISNCDYNISKIMMFAGAGVAIIGIIGLVIMLTPKKTKEENEEL